MEASEFELHDQDHTDLFGIFLAVHALPGAILFLHTTVGCKFKTQMHLADHDWFRPSHHERQWTGVDDKRLISGSGKRLVEFARSWYERRKPSIAFVTTNAAVELSSADVEAAVRELSRTLPCPVVLLKGPGYRGTLERGYRRVLQAVMERLPWEVEPLGDHVAFVGYLFDRYEMDHAANLRELRRLVEALGVKCAQVLFSGVPFETLEVSVPKAATLVNLPLAHGLGTAPRRLSVDVELPVGLEGTCQFLRQIGEACGVASRRVEALIEQEMRRAVPIIAKGARRLEGLKVGIFLDTPMAASLAAFMVDLGVEVPFVALTEREGAKVERFYETFSRLSPKGAAGPRIVLASPSRDAALEAFEEIRKEEGVEVVFGSSVQRLGLAHEGVAVIECGFPSYGRHALFPMPTFGFNGAVAIVQRLLNAVNRAF